ncbi:DNA mismatch repair protein MutS [Chelatococcus daeguensis]|uniref:MutS-related protein n=1 Tax=Chelatococcus daeguensis TaxID=444444 RepID=UPI0009EF04F9|nr:DNA mismatch repair protein MutS [Chelatococcus daeguensis]MBM3083056.1 DNA mismatch repair protein MutS [Chelatococcus daeguensis]
MKPLLMYRDRDFDAEAALPWNAEMLVQDLGLIAVFEAMAGKDDLLRDVAKRATLCPLSEPEAILYRQAVLKDCLENPAVVRDLYDLAVKVLGGEKKIGGFFLRYPGSILSRSVQVLEFFVGALRRLRVVADTRSENFASEGFRTFFRVLREELSDDYFAEIQGHLNELKLRDGVLLSAELGHGNKSTNLVLRKPKETERSWWRRLFAERPPTFSYTLHPRDEAGARALSELQDRGINLVANALAQSNDHILSFFRQLRAELAFYIACLNLRERLTEMHEPICFPVPEPLGSRRHSFSELYDIGLALNMDRKAVGNDADADGKCLVVITGANQGGKSTFLRSIGLAQLMLQAGMFVPAVAFQASIFSQVVTHFKREEDVTMRSGKLDEELLRMSEIADRLEPGAIVLFNESFAATNEREGSEIAIQIVDALVEQGYTVFFVTHLYEFAHGLFDRKMPQALFLRAERGADGTRTFRLKEGEPLQTSFGKDLYDRIFKDPYIQGTLQTSLNGGSHERGTAPDRHNSAP